MQIILLSGGSGKRLWPLSNNTRSKDVYKRQVLAMVPMTSEARTELIKAGIGIFIDTPQQGVTVIKHYCAWEALVPSTSPSSIYKRSNIFSKWASALLLQ